MIGRMMRNLLLFLLFLMIGAGLGLSPRLRAEETTGLSPHKPIVIGSDGEFTKPGEGIGCECVTGGSGTPDDPYLVEGWVIDAPRRYGIYVSNASNFIIRNVKVQNLKDPRYSGIFFDKVDNGAVEKSEVSNNPVSGAISVSDSKGVRIIGNDLEQNGWLGVSVFTSEGVSVSDNKIIGNYWGIRFEHVTNSVVSDNLIEGTKQNGMFIRGVGNSLVNNTVADSGHEGINLDTSKKTLLINNQVYGSKRYGIALYSSKNIVLENNKIHDNKNGVLFEISQNNLLQNNEIVDNGTSVVYGQRARDNNIENNVFREKKAESDSGDKKDVPPSDALEEKEKI